MTPTRSWKRFLAVSCSHGHLADPTAIEAVLKFRKEWKPHFTAHLGDFLDLAALRSGAKASPDEAESLFDDFKAGFDFLRELRPNQIFFGNHEHRITNLAQHHNAVLSFACGKALGEIGDLAVKLKAEVVPYDIEKGWRRLGDTLLGHGYMFSSHALTDHATTFGKCIIGHLHIVGQAVGFRPGAPQAYCVGTLANIPGMGYARTRKATLRWSQGFAFGEYCDDETVVWLNEKGSTWRSPL